jgi:hypothetical protein
MVVVCTSSAARGGFINGVETFDGTVKDTATWTGSSGSPITQNNELTMFFGASYTAKSFTLGVGQGVRARMALRPWTGGYEDAFLLLSSRSAGMTSTALFNDSRYVGVSATWDESFNRTIFMGVDGEVGIYTSRYVTQLTGNHTGEWFTLEVNRLTNNVFQFSVWDAAGTPLGTMSQDVTIPPPALGPGHGPVPSQLYITLNSWATWDDVTILVPEPASAVTLSGMAASLLFCRSRTRRR